MTRQEHNREESTQATCNWVEVRNQEAIAAMQTLLERSRSPEVMSKNAVVYADALVKELKGE